MKRSIALITALLVLCVSIPWAAAGDEGTIQPYWTHLRLITGAIDISTNGTASVSSSVTSRMGATERVTLITSLQQFKSGGWVEIKKWTISRDDIAAGMDEMLWPVAHGYSYRIVVTAKAYQGLQLLEQGSKTVNYGYFS